MIWSTFDFTGLIRILQLVDSRRAKWASTVFRGEGRNVALATIYRLSPQPLLQAVCASYRRISRSVLALMTSNKARCRSAVPCLHGFVEKVGYRMSDVCVVGCLNYSISELSWGMSLTPYNLSDIADMRKGHS